MNDLQQGFADIRNALLQKKMMKRDDEQRAMDNQLRREMADYQKSRGAADDTRDARDFDYRKGRDTMNDTFRGTEFDYRRGRDEATDAREDRRFAQDLSFRQSRANAEDATRTQEMAYRGGRDSVGDKFRDMEVAIKEKMAASRGAGQGYQTEDVDPETGEVMSIRRRSPLQSTGDALGAAGAVLSQQAAGGQPKSPQMTPAVLLEAVRAGKMTKDEAKRLAKQNGWN